MYRILLVDDEQNVLNALQRELHGKYEIEAFISPVAALQRGREVKFDLVISDYQMPELKGTQFLKQFGEIQPDAARMILSGQLDIDGLLGAINETHIYRFIAKPWDASELKIAIAQALDYRRITLENTRLADAYRNTHAQQQCRAQDRTHRIILVDGDEAALKLVFNGLTQPAAYGGMYDAMRRDFGQAEVGGHHDFKYVVDCFGSGLEALERIAKIPYELAVVAYKLPEMDGITFLGELRKVHPDAACILISASLDMNTLSQAVNEAHVDSFLHISWVNYELKADAMRRSWNIYQLNAAVMQALVSRDLVLENRRLAELMRE
ncbi:MAG: response regulator [Sulfuricella sp.]